MKNNLGILDWTLSLHYTDALLWLVTSQCTPHGCIVCSKTILGGKRYSLCFYRLLFSQAQSGFKAEKELTKHTERIRADVSGNWLFLSMAFFQAEDRYNLCRSNADIDLTAPVMWPSIVLALKERELSCRIFVKPVYSYKLHFNKTIIHYNLLFLIKSPQIL